MRKIKSLPLIGWREWIVLPELCPTPIKVKVDTGARTSAIHAEEVSFFSRKGKPMVRFMILPLQRTRAKAKWVECELVEKRKVKSSTGHETERPVIRTPIEMGSHRWMIEITLVNRDMMGFRMLLGRHAITKRFAVDPGHSFIQSH